MKLFPILLVVGIAVFVSGCQAGVKRVGYQLPPGKTSIDFKKCPIVIQANAKFDTNNVTVLGSIEAYDTGFSTSCDEAEILDGFAREACMLGADLINITEEKQPSPWGSSCYRAKATFVQFKDRETAKNLVSDDRYSPDAIIDRSAAASKRNRQVLTGIVLGGALGGVVVAAATSTSTRTNAAVASPRAAQP